MKYWIVNAFTKKMFSGNPATVYLCEDGFPDTSLMQLLSAEIPYSNTAFIVPAMVPVGVSRYEIRWFTPNSEAPLCGHATIAAVHILKEKGIITGDEVYFSSPYDDFRVEIWRDLEGDLFYTLEFPRYSDFEDLGDIKVMEIMNYIPYEHACLANDTILVEMLNTEMLLQFKPNLDELCKVDVRALTVTARGDGQNYDFASRYFAPAVGIIEDPVCASAHCRLIPYWSGKLGKKKMIAHKMSQRGGELLCEDSENAVYISGNAVTIFSGDF